MKNDKGELVDADFTLLDRWDDRKAIASIIKKWDKKNIDEMAKETATVRLMENLYGIELPGKAPLAKRIISLANMSNYCKNIQINGLVTHPKYRFKQKKHEKRRAITGCGKVMMAMLAKKATNVGAKSFKLRSQDGAKSFYKGIGMTAEPLNDDLFYFESDKMNSFIEKMNEEYDLGELNELA